MSTKLKHVPNPHEISHMLLPFINLDHGGTLDGPFSTKVLNNVVSNEYQPACCNLMSSGEVAILQVSDWKKLFGVGTRI